MFVASVIRNTITLTVASCGTCGCVKWKKRGRHCVYSRKYNVEMEVVYERGSRVWLKDDGEGWIRGVVCDVVVLEGKEDVKVDVEGRGEVVVDVKAVELENPAGGVEVCCCCCCCCGARCGGEY